MPTTGPTYYDMLTQCLVCDREERIGRAIEEGWVPDFWQGDVHILHPMCWECAVTHLEVCPVDGEYQVKRKRTQTTRN